MARPEIKDERRAQILEAYETCVAQYGVEGATLQKTAELAGLARPLVRHNVGNRDELLAALVERFQERSRVAMANLLENLPAKNRVRAAVDCLFDQRFSDPRLTQVSYALIAASGNNKTLAKQMRNWLSEFISNLEQLISEEHPKLDDQRISAVAAGIAGIYFNIETLYPLGNLNKLASSSREAAILLIDALEKR